MPSRPQVQDEDRVFHKCFSSEKGTFINVHVDLDKKGGQPLFLPAFSVSLPTQGFSELSV